MIFHRAKKGPALIDIAPGAAARLRLRPTLAVEEASRSVTAARAVDSYALGNALALTHDDRDAAVEEAEYLREQLRSSEAYHTHLLEVERAAGRLECASLLGELALLDRALQERV